MTLGKKLTSEKNPKSKLTLPLPAAVGKTAVEWLSSFFFSPPASFLTNEKKKIKLVSEKETNNVVHEECCMWRLFCERAPPLNFISKVSEPMLNVKELFGLLWNFLSMSEHFTGLVLPFESCSQIKKHIYHQQTGQEDKEIETVKNSHHTPSTLSPYLCHFRRRVQYQSHTVFPSSSRLTFRSFPITFILLKSILTAL